MDVCEKSNLKVAFYFIPENLEKMNGSYDLNDKKIKDLIKYIDVRGHEIGLHGSYQTYQDEEKAIKQYSMLNSTLHNLGINQKIIGNRQHYLRWDASITPQILDSMNLQYDTTGGYADMAGFRYGICYEFTMFDFINRKKLKIKQRPLIVMECSVIAEKYMNLGYTKKTIKTIKDLKKKCHSFNGVFTLLWHNSHFLESGDKEIFKKILSDES